MNEITAIINRTLRDLTCVQNWAFDYINYSFDDSRYLKICIDYISGKSLIKIIPLNYCNNDLTTLLDIIVNYFDE